MIRKVIFLGDLYRSCQDRNVYRLYHLFSPIISSLGVDCSCLVTDENKVFKESDIEIKIWMEAFQNKKIHRLDNIDLVDTAIIGFELPDYYLSYLDKKNIKWINFSIHPLRFLDDLYFSLDSSFECNTNSLSITDEYINLCASLLQLRYGNINNSKKKSSLFFFGQMPHDKSVWFDNEFKTVESYFDTLDSLAEKYSHILYRKHPHVHDNELYEKLSNRYDVEIDDSSSAYELLCSNRVSAVCAISSSILVEARYFGLESFYLENRAKRFRNAISYKSLINKKSIWLSDLLDCNLENSQEGKKLSSVITTNLLRDVFGYWGYDTEDRKLKSCVAHLSNDIAHLSNDVACLSKNIEKQDYQIERLLQEVESLSEFKNEILLSRSWKITCALKKISNLTRSFNK